MANQQFKVGDVIQKNYGTNRVISYITWAQGEYIGAVSMTISRNDFHSLTASDTYKIDDVNLVRLVPESNDPIYPGLASLDEMVGLNRESSESSTEEKEPPQVAEK